MSVTRSTVREVATLARLSIADDALGDVTDQFTRILTMIEELRQVDTDGVQPMSNPHDMVQRLRTDEVTEDNQRAALQRVAPEIQDGYFIVPKVID